MGNLTYLDMVDLYIIKHMSDGSNISQVSKIMCLTQPAISHRVKKINHALGYKFYFAYGKKLSLTSNGMRMAEAVNRCLSILENEIAPTLKS